MGRKVWISQSNEIIRSVEMAEICLIIFSRIFESSYVLGCGRDFKLAV